jgi:hypothetical protein
MENSSPQYWKNDPEEGGKTYLKQNFLCTNQAFGLNIKEDYFKLLVCWW